MRLFRKDYFDDCDEGRKFTMYPILEITFFKFNFTREANQKSEKSLAWNSQQHFLFSSPGPTKIHQIHTDIQKSKYSDTRITAYI